MAMNNKGRSNKSLCEKSMKMAANIVKLSSFSIAKMSLGISPPPPTPTRKHSSLKSSVKANRTPIMPPQFRETQRAQEPMGSSKPVSYVMEPIEEKGSSVHVVHEKSVDGRAWDYIRKVHEKNRAVSGEATTFSPFILPPPPHYVEQ